MLKTAWCGGPRGFEPAEVDCEAESEENQKVAPVAGLVRVGLRGLMHEESDYDREKSVEGEPAPTKVACGDGRQKVWDAQGDGQ